MIKEKNFNDNIFKSLCVVSAPSGAGKTSLIKKIMSLNPNILVCTSETTRKPRKGEIDGVDYIFVSKDDFSHKMKNEQYLEHAEVHGNYYGTLVDSVVKLIEKNILVILEIDYQGAEIIKEKLPLSRNIFVLPPSLSELEKRLRERGTDSEKVILERLQNAKNELNQAHRYDYILVNDNFELAEQRLLSYVLDVNMLIDEKIRKEPLIDRGF